MSAPPDRAVAAVRVPRRLFAPLHARPAAVPWLLLSPGLGWLLLFFLAPLGIIGAYSFLEPGLYGGVEPSATLSNYRDIFDPLYAPIVLRSLWLAVGTTAACLAIGYPMAYVIAGSRRWKHLLLLLVVLPFWTSFLIRTYGMMFLMRDTGIINTMLTTLGIADEPLRILYTPAAVLVGLVYVYLPFMVLPLYASIEKLDPAYLEAAEVLGARPLARFLTVTVPLTLPGIAAGSLLVFIPSLGAFLTPDLLGGARAMMVGNLIQEQFTTARNWPFGSAISLVLMAAVLMVLLFYVRWRGRPRLGD